ncbi:hypothetical protein CUMW_286880, partial [Citrus unshiu]
MLVKFRNLIPESCSKRMCPLLSFGYFPLAKCSTTFDWKLEKAPQWMEIVNKREQRFLLPDSRLSPVLTSHKAKSARSCI